MNDFTPLPDDEFRRLSPEELVAYHTAARKAGHHDEAFKALKVLISAFEDRVHYWVRKVPREHREDVAQDVFLSALKSSFEGEELRSFGAWLRQIAHRRVADFFGGEERRIKGEPLAEEHEGDEEVWGVRPGTPDFADEVITRDLVERALATFNEVHQRVIEIAGPKDLGFEAAPAKETAQRINDQLSDHEGDPMTDVNVHKILSRFRKRLADLLEADNQEQGDG